MKLRDVIGEMPLGRFDTTGDFDKGSSFRDKKDRQMISNPRFKDIVAKKFSKSYYTINMFFVNTPQANKHTEVGAVDLDWVKENLGEEVAKKVEPHYQEEGEVNIIFTNNKGDQRVPMTPWIIAHRMGHAFARRDMNWGRGSEHQFRAYKEVIDAIGDTFEIIFHDVYGVKSFSKRGGHGPDDRTSQLLMKALSHHIGSFKSARDKKLRDYFELYNELFAQYMITGDIKFNELPRSFPAHIGRGDKRNLRVHDEEAYEEMKDLGSLERTLEYYFDEMLSAAEEYILVM